MQNLTGDMLPRPDSKSSLVHREIAKLVRAQHIVRFQTGVQTLRGPYATNGGLALEENGLAGWVDLAVCFECDEAVETYTLYMS